MKFKSIVVLVSSLLFSVTLFGDGLTLKSDDISGQISVNQVFNGFGCTGKNISPNLSWSGAPKNTKSFALTMYDPDAPTGSGWWHWIAFNIDKKTSSLATGASNMGLMPKGTVESITDYAKGGFGGACPPKGDKAHSYIITVYALDIEKLELNKSANPALVGYMLNMHTIEKSSIISFYKR